MARQHLERADIAVMVVDASVGVTSHDATIASYAEQSGRSVIIVMNKWDLALEAAQEKGRDAKKSTAEKAPARIPASCSRITSRWSARNSSFSLMRRWFFFPRLPASAWKSFTR